MKVKNQWKTLSTPYNSLICHDSKNMCRGNVVENYIPYKTVRMCFLVNSSRKEIFADESSKMLEEYFQHHVTL